jgi:hypothetical protein
MGNNMTKDEPGKLYPVSLTRYNAASGLEKESYHIHMGPLGQNRLIEN